MTENLYYLLKISIPKKEKSLSRKKKKKELTDEWKVWALNWHYTLMRLFDKLVFFNIYLSAGS